MRYFLRRAGFFVATLWAAITLNFLIPRLQPGDPAEAIVRKLVGRNASIDPAQLQSVRLMLGVSDKNLFQQYLDYLGAIVRGDFGVSFTYFPYKVTDVIAQAMPWTIVLVGVTTIVSFVVGTLLGSWAAYRRGSRVDSVLTLGSTFLGTLPFFWIALMLIFLFCFTWQVFPESGGYGDTVPGWNWPFIGDAISHAALPMIALLITGPLGWILAMRNNMVQTLGEDYSRLAKAKGLGERKIALNYGARIAILPSVTGFALALGGLLGGTILVETIFNYPGLGRLLFEAVGNSDYPLLQAIFLLTTVGVLVANLAADVLYGVLDPRVRKAATA
ncbi:peptide/nickel transport system permease protein [Leifsonia sp. 98AMF]|jgi:peptide/nickel transport system permease protein|uniref:ABC transporter permease n=1 Tax=unclassified Leifsonia TaxID=2663824 RepID=UPI00036001B5|nr:MULTISPECIES: ABC transporter permease [unclassified Leifsonia]TDP98716.1 peptide/nickel transport system permease protein [Leifsonia sp. 115AMFTsu3.1]SDH67981.1 peptide/nickel transport system permease protein [Leifsonia sp. 197AMF]SDI71743.1 peptide/nickel transport system permease protein [Leifsonia sp. 466MF]SDK17882.1 peptide/nickel transport system permease protein [Leifsonia sp. 157MF]SDN74459.1 peptide/nickel transport system permease protein [Leifsonia sp. 509MF]